MRKVSLSLVARALSPEEQKGGEKMAFEGPKGVLALGARPLGAATTTLVSRSSLSLFLKTPQKIRPKKRQVSF
jgi:hypothetical protein